MKPGPHVGAFEAFTPHGKRIVIARLVHALLPALLVKILKGYPRATAAAKQQQGYISDKTHATINPPRNAAIIQPK